MMTMTDIYKYALQYLRDLAFKQRQLCERATNPQKIAEWRSMFFDTKAKIDWLERLINMWEGQ